MLIINAQPSKDANWKIKIKDRKTGKVLVEDYVKGSERAGHNRIDELREEHGFNYRDHMISLTENKR